MSDPTRFDLDDRQRAMLAEMGVRVWWPQGPADEQSPIQSPVQTVAQAQVLAAPLNVALPASSLKRLAPTAVPMSVSEVWVGKPLAEGLEQMDWAALQATVANCQACDLCANRQQAVFGVGDVQADWMVIGDPQVEAEGQHGEPFVGQAKQLLHNMLKAVGLNREGKGEGGVYITSSLKCRLPGSRNPSPQELATCEPYLARQVALVKPKVMVLMGRFSIQAVLQSTEPLGKLRGQVHSYQGVPVVATYHPDALLRNLPDKGKAWVDLVLASQVVRGL
jgi:uracil-DNA glycosylase family 4